MAGPLVRGSLIDDISETGVDGSLIRDESVPGTWNSAVIFETELGCLSWERARRTECCLGMEDIAMLVFYLPIIIFEAMLEANTNKRKADESTVI
jgi:hypothetical protein